MNDIIKLDPELIKDGNKLFCTLCITTIEWSSKYGMSKANSHRGRKKHLELLSKNRGKIVTIKQGFKIAMEKEMTNEEFYKWLTQHLVEADVPFDKLDSCLPFIRLLNGLLKTKPRNIPCSKTLRTQVDDVYEERIQQIRDKINEDKIYLIIDESTDIKGRFVCNVLVGALNGQPSKPMLLLVKFLDQVNTGSICQTVNETCSLLWKGNIEYARLLLVVSDQASYMVSAIRCLKETKMYPNLHHITCIVHALHRVLELIRSNYEEVNNLVTALKKVLLNSKSRRIKFVSSTGLPLPPQVIITRWSSWLNASFYYANNFDKVKAFGNSLKENSQAIKDAKKIMKSENVQNELIALMQYDFIPKKIEKLETRGLRFDEQIDIVLEVKGKLTDAPFDKLNKSLEKNPDIYNFENYSKKSFELRSITMYAPCVSVDVERSFSVYKYILSVKRTNFTLENLKKYNVIYYNSFFNY